MNTLPTDSAERKEYPLFRGLLRYFPAALAGVARHSKRGNDKHNPGEEMHHARGKSSDHADCIVRHLVDLADMLAAIDRGDFSACEQPAALLAEADALVWRACALSQELYEIHAGAPMAPAARGPVRPLCKQPECGGHKVPSEPLSARMVPRCRAENAKRYQCERPAGHDGDHAYETREPLCPICKRIECKGHAVPPAASFPTPGLGPVPGCECRSCQEKRAPRA